MALTRRAEDTYRTLATGLPGGMAVIVDHDLRYLLADGQGLAVAGLAPGDLEGKTIFEALPPGFAEQYAPHFRQALEGKPFVIENQSYGHEYLTQGTPLLDDTGKVYAVLAVSYDVTSSAERAFAAKERSRAEADLRRSEERFRTLVTAVSDFVFQLSPDWRETRSLQTAAVLDEQLDPRLPWIDAYVPPGESDRMRAAVAEAIANKSVFELEHRVQDPNGTEGWAFSRAVPLLGEDGEIVEWFGASSVISERKHAEEALRKSEESYRTLFASVQESLLLGEIFYNDAGQLDLLYTEVNPAYEALTGLSREQLIGRNSRSVLPSLEEEWYDAAAVAALSGRTEHLERYAAPLGRWLSVRYTPAGEPGDGKVVIMASDVTKRREAEDALRRLNETLEQQVEERTEALLRSQLRFQQAFEVGPMAAVITTLDEERFVNVNRTFCRLSGYAEDEVLGKTAAQLGMWSSPEDRAKQRGALTDGGSRFQEVELRLMTKDGSLKDILASGAIIKLDGGDGWLRLFVDVTEKKRSQEELMLAIEAVVADSSLFGRKVIERLSSARSAQPSSVGFEQLTTRELEVLQRMAQGMTSAQIAEDLDIAQKTVTNHIGNIYAKIGVNSRTQAVLWARERGFVG